MVTLTKHLGWFGAAIVFGVIMPYLSRADQIVMQNGDLYHGKILSVSATNVVFQSEVLGVVNLARSRVVKVAMEARTATNVPPAAAAVKTTSSPDLAAAVRQLGSQSNLMQQVRAQFLTAASPAANEKFSQMINDLTTGRMSVEDLRAQAKSAAEQLRALQADGGDDASGAAGLYLSILDGFLAETQAPLTQPTTNAPVRSQP